MNNKHLIVIVGPTAVGKTSLGISLAQHYHTEIISADSRQLYKDMDIGTAKPTAEEQEAAVHHFVNILKIEEDYNAGQFESDALVLLEKLFLKNDVVLAVGGSGLYVNALCQGMDDMPTVDPKIRQRLNTIKDQNGLEPLAHKLSALDPEYFKIVDQKNPQRIIRALEVIESSGKTFTELRRRSIITRPFNIIKIGLELPRENLYSRINDRMDLMIEQGLFSEAEELFDKRSFNALQTVGYSEIFGFLEGRYDKEEAIRLLKRNSRRYAKRQLTWFRKDESTRWFSPGQLSQILEYIEKQLDV